MPEEVKKCHAFSSLKIVSNASAELVVLASIFAVAQQLPVYVKLKPYYGDFKHRIECLIINVPSLFVTIQLGSCKVM